MSGPRTGGCLCGAVRYRVDGPLRPIVMCHCTQCRRMTGHFLAATAARRGHFTLAASEGLRWYSASPHARRGFCERCGSTLFWEGEGRDYISIAAGSLDDSSGLAIAAHIFTADKGGYYDIEPGAVQSPDGTFRAEFPAR
ncbi:MAG: GFA family protein [Proteobacteria bacterium]|nr:GFA family protein [Pseudomonadota bacterium]